MKITVREFSCKEANGVVIALFEGNIEVKNEETNNYIQSIKNKGQFKGKNGEVFNFIRNTGKELQDVVILGLGKEEDLTSEQLRLALASGIKKAKELKNKSIFVRIPSTEKLSIYETVKASAEGIGLGAYSFNKYKENGTEEEVVVSIGGPGVKGQENEAKKGLEEGLLMVDTTIIARDLVNEPANILYPETLGKAVKEIGNNYGFQVEVKDEKEIKALGMDAFLSVGKGSANKPRLIVMRYFGDEDNKEKILGLVGKGLTFDAGGYTIKPTAGMLTMKCDMGGAAAVIGSMAAIAKGKCKINVVAVVAACENLISGESYKPGDVIGSMAGKTIEIVNTDAEGRLTLADAVTYIVREEKVAEVIDIATLTGAALSALGTTTTAVVTNDDEFYRELEAVTKYTGEQVWQLPSFPEYKKLLSSNIADLKNATKVAGTIAAGLFIGEFVEAKPWLHLDIAGTAWCDGPRGYCQVGGTGEPVRTIYELAKRRSKQ